MTLKLALAQITTVVGDFEGNLQKIRSASEQARAHRASVVLFPELTVCGYPAGDHLGERQFLDASDAAFGQLLTPAAWSKGLTLIVGFPERHSGPGVGVYNAAAVIRDGTILATARKNLLPDYGVFDERRWFDPATEPTLLELEGVTFGLSICEDAWNDPSFETRPWHRRNPIQTLADLGATVILNLAASPYHLGKAEQRRERFACLAKHHGVFFVSTNLMGATDHLIFDGSSLVADPLGKTHILPAFEEKIECIELEPLKAKDCSPLEPGEELRRALVLGIRSYVHQSGFDSALLGVSGGMDSALVAALAAEALGPTKLLGVRLPSRFTSDASNDDAFLLAKNLGFDLETLPIEACYHAALETLDPLLKDHQPSLMEENLQARLRGLLLMALSNEGRGLLLATGNKSELAVGYSTLYGDLCGALVPIGDLWKTQVYEVAEAVNAWQGSPCIPQNIFDKAPTAELRPDQRDEDSLPPYERLDPLLKDYVEAQASRKELVLRGHDPHEVDEVLRLLRRAEFKRTQAPPILKVSPRPFSGSWRMPLATRWQP